MRQNVILLQEASTKCPAIDYLPLPGSSGNRNDAGIIITDYKSLAGTCAVAHDEILCTSLETTTLVTCIRNLAVPYSTSAFHCSKCPRCSPASSSHIRARPTESPKAEAADTKMASISAWLHLPSFNFRRHDKLQRSKFGRLSIVAKWCGSTAVESTHGSERVGIR